MTRRGVTLLEALIVVTMLGMLGALAARSTRLTERTTRARLSRDAAAIVADDVVRISEAAIAGRGGTLPLAVFGDTAIDWSQLVARGLPCAAGGDTVLLPLSSTSIWWGGPPDTIDVVTMEQRDGTRSAHRVRDVRQRAATPSCPTGSWRLHLDPPQPAGALPIRALAHVERRVRFVVYRASDGAWWWGERRCAIAGGCGTVQPITGPLPAGRTSLRVDSTATLIALSTLGLDARRRATLARWP